MPDNQPVGNPPNAPAAGAPPRRQVPPADPCAMVVFGAGGDMVKRLLIPALYNLCRTNVLPDNLRSSVSMAEDTAKWRDILRDAEKLRRQRHRESRIDGSIPPPGNASRRRCPTSRATTNPELYEKLRRIPRPGEGRHTGQRDVLPRGR